MKILGISIEGKKCTLVVLDTATKPYEIQKTIPKIEVSNVDNQEELKMFFKTISAFTRDEGIDEVCVKQRNKRGEYAGGAEGFKLESIIQLLEIPVNLISPTAIAAKLKKHDIYEIKSTLFVYQEEAFKTAFVGAILNARF